MSCARRELLEGLFSAAIARFDNAKARFLERIAISSKDECLALNNAVDHAVDLMNHSRAALDLHIRQHSQSLRMVSLSRLTALFGDSAATLRDCQETVG